MIIDYGGGQSITLTALAWENTDTRDIGIVNNVSRGGTINGLKRPFGAEIRHYKIVSQTASVRDAFKTLLINNRGNVATITDDYRSFKGVLSSEAIEIVTVKDNCAYDWEFDILVASEGDALLTEAGDALLTEANEVILV